MGLLTIALNNLRRQKGRTFFLLLSLVLSVSTVVGLYLLTTSMRTEIGDKFDQIGANILILPAENRQSFSYGGVSLPGAVVKENLVPETMAEQVRTIKNRESIAVVAPKLLGVLNSERGRVLGIGVRFPAELRLKKWWQIRISPAGQPVQYAPKFPVIELQADEVLLGAAVAERWQLDVGQTLQVKGQTLRIKGVIEPTGGEEDRALWLDLATMQKLTGKEKKVTFLELAALCNTCPIDDIVRQLTEKLPGTRVMAVKAAVEARKAIVERFALFALALAGLILFLGAVMVLLTMSGAVKERTREIGILRAIGYRRSHIITIICTEAAVLGLAAGVAGFGSGTLLASLGAPLVAGMEVPVPWDPLVAVISMGGALLLGLLAAFWPAWQGSRLDPVTALRYL